MYDVSLREFLTLGELGPIVANLSRKKILDLLGSPQDWGSEKNKNQARIWKYDSLQIWFDDDRLNFIGIYFYSPLALPKNLRLLGYFPDQEATLAEFVQQLNDDFNYKIDPQLTFGTQLCLTFGSQVSAIFEWDENELRLRKLNSIFNV